MANNTQFPVDDCIGAGRIEGWFIIDAGAADEKGWGHVKSFSFEGKLFFHLQRSPGLRGIDYKKDDPCTFEVVEVNGRYEAIKLVLPSQQEEIDHFMNMKGEGDILREEVKPLLGRRVGGYLKSTWMVVVKQHWGLCASNEFAGQVFFHQQNNPEMCGIEYDREDEVEFTLTWDDNRKCLRASSMVLLHKKDRPYQDPERQAKRMKSMEYFKTKGEGKGQFQATDEWSVKPTLSTWPNAAGEAGMETGRMLPMYLDGDLQAKLSMCLSSFEDMINGHDEQTTGIPTLNKVRSFVAEANDVIGEDKQAKHSFAMSLSKHPWFRMHEQEVRYKPGKNEVTVAKVIGAMPEPTQGWPQPGGYQQAGQWPSTPAISGVWQNEQADETAIQQMQWTGNSQWNMGMY